MLSGDSINFKTKKGNVFIVDKDSKDGLVWTSSDSINFGVVKLKDGSNKFKTKEGNMVVYSISEDDDKSLSKVWVQSGDEEHKTLEFFISEDEMDGKKKIVEIEELLSDDNDEVKVIKYKADKGEYVVKAEVYGKDSKELNEKLKKLGLEDKEKLEIKKIEIGYETDKGEIELEFELMHNDPIEVNVHDEEGKIVFTDKVKKFEGKYSNKIDLSKEKGNFFYLRINQGTKSKTKLIKK